MNKGIVEVYEEANGKFRHIFYLETQTFGEEGPISGDIIIAPLHKRDFKEPRDPSVHEAYEVIRRYIVPDRQDADAIFPRLKLLVKPRSLTAAEASMWPSD
jgi:hypothetical protein